MYKLYIWTLDLQMSIPGNPYVSFANLLRPLALSEGRLPSHLLGVHFGWAIFVPAAPDGITSYPSGGAFQLEKPLWISEDLSSFPPAPLNRWDPGGLMAPMKDPF